ncbi:MAG TPA: lytic murein transglycosylase [Aestuariivirgaceae bacterium]|jgi:membrane-bound lytic murein transglycosylase B|nr:lytic murein transglycosylase [Aestuariivirgaceae bacterium]
MNRGRTIKLVAAVIVAATLSGPPVRAELPATSSGVLGQLMGDVASDRFGRFVDDFWPEARRAGISRRIYERAFRGVGPDPSVLQLAQDQPEFKTPVSDYLSKRVTPQRIAAGQGMAQTYVATLDRIERRYGVDREILLAIWGMESNFGSHKGEMSVIRSLATLAYTGSRRKFGRSQLIAALRILQRGDIDADGFTGSWAGAMGHTQFIPTTYNAYAVDWTGDGRRDIWNSIEDALASTANYLAHSGWQRGLKWGYEVQLPARLDRRLIGEPGRRSLAAWARLGVKPANGQGFGASDAGAYLVLPAGSGGPAFLVTRNFKAILKYNAAVSYALAVGHLGDRIGGADGLIASWPQDQRALGRVDRPPG